MQNGQTPLIDIQRDAGMILREAARAAQTILARRNALDKAGRGKETLIVLAGENHAQASHTLHLMAVINLLKERERIAVALEAPSNLIERRFRRLQGRAATVMEKRFLKERDKSGHLSLNILPVYLTLHCRHTKEAMIGFLQRHNIMTQFTDAAHMTNAAQPPKTYLDARDAATAKSLNACFGLAPAEIEADAPKGIRVRNHHIMKRATRFAEKMQARIMIQHCGLAHVAGWMPEDIKPKHSLSSLFKDKNIPFIAMSRFSGPTVPDHISAHNKLSASEELFITGLPDRLFHYPAEMKNGVRDRLLDQETEYSNVMLTKMNMAADVLSARASIRQRHLSNLFIREIFAQCQKEARPTVWNTITSRIADKLDL